MLSSGDLELQEESGLGALGAVGEGFFSSSPSHLIITGSVLWTRRIVLLCPGGGGLAMTSRRHRLKLRRSLSEQLRSSTSKAWDLLWRNVRERRVAGQYPAAGSPSPAGRAHSGGGGPPQLEKKFFKFSYATNTNHSAATGVCGF